MKETTVYSYRAKVERTGKGCLIHVLILGYFSEKVWDQPRLDGISVVILPVLIYRAETSRALSHFPYLNDVSLCVCMPDTWVLFSLLFFQWCISLRKKKKLVDCFDCYKWKGYFQFQVLKMFSYICSN